MSVFISYSQKDDAIYKNFCLTLEGQKIHHWCSQSMFVGKSLREQLRLAINQSDVCVFLATKNSIKSEWCSAELGAFWGRGISVIVYILDSDLSDEAIPTQFKGDLWTRDPREVIKAIKEEVNSVSEKRNVDFGIKILKPAKCEKANNPITVSGTFKIKPPYHCLAIWECDPQKNLYWPKKYIHFDHFNYKWSVTLELGGNGGAERQLLVAAMGDNGKALFEYSRKVIEMNKELRGKYLWPGVELLPSDITVCDCVTVIKGE